MLKRRAIQKTCQIKKAPKNTKNRCEACEEGVKRQKTPITHD